MPSRVSHRPALPIQSTLLAALLSLTVLAGCASAPTGSVHTPQQAALASNPASNPASMPASALDGTPPPVQSGNDAQVEQRFAQWVARFQDTARAAGIDEATLHAAFDHVRLRPRLVEQDRAQPEFTRTLWDYLEAVVSPQRIATGQQKLLQFRTEADAATTRYGVPGPILAAVWGMESNYGRNYGDVPVIDALATLGFEGRRESWAKGELLAALKILQRGDIDRDHMIGSWAGAMGQTQFMPSSFLSYAVDADGDGRRDIWGSMADVLASTANFLARSGWQADETWGAEVQVPTGFDPARADPAVRQASAQWALDGVRSLDGAPLPNLADAAILQPAGARGPSFIVGRNYRTILRYNNSTSYALTVCMLAQRIAGGPAVQAAWPRDLRALTRSDMLALQTALNRRGFDSGTPDGQMGPATRRALQQFQRSKGLPADGYPTAELLELLQQDQ
ncbi:MAG: lytic murein transglycosylase [Burkholderiales bacterium]|nr:lytic murein transglycosylase [Burkholderiales bacterium]